MKNNSEVVFLSYDEALDLVARISTRCENFNYDMADTEKVSMAQLLSDVGVKVSDLIDVSNLADNYAINAQIASPEEANEYSRSALRDALFSWEEGDGTYYCLSW